MLKTNQEVFVSLQTSFFYLRDCNITWKIEIINSDPLIWDISPFCYRSTTTLWFTCGKVEPSLNITAYRRLLWALHQTSLVRTRPWISENIDTKCTSKSCTIGMGSTVVINWGTMRYVKTTKCWCIWLRFFFRRFFCQHFFLLFSSLMNTNTITCAKICWPNLDLPYK